MIAEEDSSRVIQNLVLDRNSILELMIIAQNNILRILQRSMIDQGHLRNGEIEMQRETTP